MARTYAFNAETRMVDTVERPEKIGHPVLDLIDTCAYWVERARYNKRVLRTFDAFSSVLVGGSGRAIANMRLTASPDAVVTLMVGGTELDFGDWDRAHELPPIPSSEFHEVVLRGRGESVVLAFDIVATDIDQFAVGAQQWRCVQGVWGTLCGPMGSEEPDAEATPRCALLRQRAGF